MSKQLWLPKSRRLGKGLKVKNLIKSLKACCVVIAIEPIIKLVIFLNYSQEEYPKNFKGSGLHSELELWTHQTSNAVNVKDNKVPLTQDS